VLIVVKDTRAAGGGFRDEILRAMENDWPWWVILIFVGVLFGGYGGLLWYFDERRRDAMAKLASRLGLTPWPDNSLPSDLRLRGTTFDGREPTRNVYSGVLHGREIAVFDVFNRTNYMSRGDWGTILAVRTSDAVFKNWYGLDAERAGEWVLFGKLLGFTRYTPLIPVKEVERRLLALADRPVARQ